MSASNSLAGPLRSLSTRLMGVSLKEMTKAVSPEKQKNMFILMTPLDTVALPSTYKNTLLQGLTFRQPGRERYVRASIIHMDDISKCNNLSFFCVFKFLLLNFLHSLTVCYRSDTWLTGFS